ncbi:hypothetical protein [Mycolicibacterium mageritense]|nr:hypothetical protein [Mycolicibacterium mageritense]MCC9181589.1 hypothetical protein [Mycolicibacterium mageritense]CDO21402.1 hypothetical protein BN978_01863 [Mycolicibacterium mageritense DSM 44476 = CIP 104973]
MNKMTIKACLAIMAVFCALTACIDREDPPSERAVPTTMFPNWPPELNGFRFRWTAEPGIDLLTGPAIPVRAYLESYRVGLMTKSINNTYPGFERAIPAIPDRQDRVNGYLDWEKLPFQLKWIRPAIDDSINFGDGPFFGNEYFHVIELSPLEDGYLTYVCDGIYNVFHPAIGQPGKYSSVADYLVSGGSDVERRERYTVKLWRIEFKNSDSATGSKQPQVGANPAPVGDVFGSWRIEGASSDNYWGSLSNVTHSPQDPDYVQRLQQCRDTMPHNVTERAKILTSVVDSPPPAEPAEPGWPSQNP